jgi:glycosyltransferase involved in cell wall biosynthesis
MRIVVAALPTAPGGGLTMLHDLLEAWPKADELLVLAWRPATVDALRGTGHTVSRIEARSTVEAVARLWRMPALVRRFQPEVTWSQAVRLPLAATPQAVHWRNILSFEPVQQPSIRMRVRRVRESADLRRADLRVFNSEAILEAAARAHPAIKDRPSVVVPNGLRLEQFLAAGERATPEDGTLRVLLPQSDSPHKQNPVAAEVIARLASALPPGFSSIRLLVPGAGAYRDLRQCLARHGLEQVLDLRGPLTRGEMADLYAQSHVVLLTSKGESFCNPAIEAAAASRPLVAPPIAALRETAGPLGFLTDSWQPDALTQAIRTAIATGTAQALSQQARKHAQEFTAASSAATLRCHLVNMRHRLRLASPDR